MQISRRILTRQPAIPWIWVLLINIPWFVALYTLFVMGQALPLTLRRYTDSTPLISFVTSVGLICGIVIGPVVNYLSDRIWTRLGRRRPFLIMASLGTLAAMAFIPYMPGLGLLILLVVISSILGDVGSTLEPLWLEVLPAGRRGSGIAMRTFLISFASLYFFQVMFAQMNATYSWDLPWVGLIHPSGEQVLYFSAAALQVVNLFLLSFIIKEVKPDDIALSRWREVDFRPISFIVRFVREVFGEKRWWRVYLFYVAPAFASMALGWFGFSNFMLLEQFNYDMPSIAQCGLPATVLHFFLTPLIGWYSDRLPSIHRGLLALVCALSLGTLIWFVPWVGESGPRTLPPLWAMFVMCALVFLTLLPAMLIVIQTLRKAMPAGSARLWAWYLGGINSLLLGVGGMLVIKFLPVDGVPSITIWYLVVCVGSGFNFLGIVSGPLLYDLIPKDKIGTLSSGFGLLVTACTAVVQNAFGLWIGLFKSEGRNDYSSGYYLQIALAVLSLVMMTYFLRMSLKGKLVEYGRLGINSTDAS